MPTSAFCKFGTALITLALLLPATRLPGLVAAGRRFARTRILAAHRARIHRAGSVATAPEIRTPHRSAASPGVRSSSVHSVARTPSRPDRAEYRGEAGIPEGQSLSINRSHLWRLR